MHPKIFAEKNSLKIKLLKKNLSKKNFPAKKFRQKKFLAEKKKFFAKKIICRQTKFDKNFLFQKNFHHTKFFFEKKSFIKKLCLKNEFVKKTYNRGKKFREENFFAKIFFKAEKILGLILIFLTQLLSQEIYVSLFIQS